MIVYALLVAVGIYGGVAIAEQSDPRLADTAAAYALAWGASALVCWLCARRPLVQWLAVLLAGGAVGAWQAYVQTPAQLDALRPATVVGDVYDVVDATDGHERWWLELMSVEQDGRTIARADRAVLAVAPPIAEKFRAAALGQRITFSTKLYRPTAPHNPGLSDRAIWSQAHGVKLQGALPANVRVVGAASVWSRLRADVCRLRRYVIAHAAPAATDEDAALFRSLVLGDRLAISSATEDGFRRAGVTHILSVSGLHLGAVAWLFFTLTRLAAARTTLSRRWPATRIAAAFTLPPIVIYTLITGAQIATVRAALMSGAVFLAMALGRTVKGSRALGIAVVLTLLVSPYELFDPSLQLSVISVATCLWLAPRFMIAREHPAWLRWPTALLTTSCCVFLTTLPLCAYHFQSAAPLSIVTNLWAIPFGELVVVPIGLVASVAQLFHLPWCMHGAIMLCALLRYCVCATGKFAPLIAIAHHSLACWLLYGATLSMCLMPSRAKPRMFAALVGAWLGAIALHTLVRDRAARITFLDVGQGDAAVITLPTGETILVDGGGSFDPRFDPGRTILVPFLRSQGVKRIDTIVLSHPHPDHANGLPTVMRTFSVGAIWYTGQDSHLPALVEMRKVAAERHIPFVSDRTRTIGAATFTALHPLADGLIAADPTRGENDNSLVLLGEFAGRRVLLAGDIEWTAELNLARAGAPKIDVLKTPHHGSRTSSSSFLLQQLQPAVAVISVGRDNRWGFPHASVVARTQRWAQIFRTDRDGGVTLRIAPSGELSVTATHSAVKCGPCQSASK